MAVLPALKGSGNPISFNIGKATLKDGTKVRFPKNSIVSGKSITKADGTNLAPGTYESDKGNFTVGNDGLVHQVGVVIAKEEIKVIIPEEIKPVIEAVIAPQEDLTIKVDAKEPETPAETSPEAKIDPKPDTEVIAEVKPEVVADGKV